MKPRVLDNSDDDARLARRERWEERAAIHEFDANLSRATSEELATIALGDPVTGRKPRSFEGLVPMAGKRKG